MTDAAGVLPRPPLFGIASCQVGPNFFDFEIGWDEFERDVDWAESLLRSAGLGRGDLVLITISQWEGPWTTPVVRALRRIGATYLPAEVWSFDARRTSMFLQRLPVKAIFGLGGDTITGLETEQPPINQLLQEVEIVWARPDALDRLSGVAPQVLPFVKVGPALGLGVPGQPGVLVDAGEWAIESENGELVVSNVRERAASFDRLATGVRGSVRSAGDGAVTIELEKNGA
ncbi:hypothetical protein MYCO108962_00505 [Mycobacterium colombiense]|uniref:AMP-dependent synthetase/ligase domain-containing protein n=1 Tax=Mycobacterium colombiense CECT 3035 TaxID=1041522 RepID=J5EIS4_9MYCO|nr:hypothetical protein [Mycobacterium colombiense]EJO89409.1 hypothetical protein MCOL_V204450 [Mycobacterium colombiense CECT 3035]